ncbi:MAG: hypothetical protein ABEJ59_05430 [Halanaeroarchaeum sp.]
MAASETPTDARPETRELDFGHTTVELVRDPTNDEWTVRSESAPEPVAVKEFDFGCTKARLVRDADAEDGWVQEDIPATPASQRVHA